MKLVDLAFYLVYISTYIIVVPIGVGIYFRKYLSPVLKLLLLALFIVFVLDLSMLFFDLKSSSTFFYLFSFFDLLMMTWIFSLLIISRKIRRLIVIFSFLCGIFIFVDAFYISGISSNGLSNALEKSFILIIAIYFLTQLFQDKIESDLLKEPLFWMSVGIIAYNLVGSFDIFNNALVNYSQNLYLQYYVFWSITTIFTYCAFAYAFKLSKQY